MKTHIIHIQAEDDWRLAAARLPRTAGDRAVLVWPEKAGPTPLEASLRLINRQAQRRSQQVAVASQRSGPRLAAQQLGLPVFNSAEEAGKADWHTDEVEEADRPHERPTAAELRQRAGERRQRPEPPQLTVRLAWFALGVLAFLLTAALLIGLRMRILAVDPGDARIGLALSDPTGTLASPLTIIEHVARDQDAARIAALAAEHEAGAILVGQALDSEGRPGLQARKARRLASAIREQTETPVELWDESGSSQVAQQARLDLGVGQAGRQQPVDDEAAAVILQSYLDAQKTKPA